MAKTTCDDCQETLDPGTKRVRIFGAYGDLYFHTLCTKCQHEQASAIEATEARISEMWETGELP